MVTQDNPLGNAPLDYALLQRLTQAFGPSGSEEEVSDIIAEAARPVCDEIRRDSMGNLLAVRHGGGKRIMVAAHMDEVGLMVTHIDEQGFLRFATIGGIKLTDLPNRRVRLKNGRLGCIGVEKLEKPGDLEMGKLFVDIGASSQEEANQLTGIGEPLVFAGEYTEMGSRLMSKAMDDRLGCFIALEALKRVSSGSELAFVFSVQEEVGLRGARVAAYALEPDLAISVDLTFSGDTPKSSRLALELGGGVAIMVMDHSMITPPRIKRWMADVANRKRIKYQWEVLESGGTDAGAIHLTRAGIPSGVLSVPARNIHTPSEIVDCRDVEGAVELLTALLDDGGDKIF